MTRTTSATGVAESHDGRKWAVDKSLILLLDDVAERFPHQEAVVSLHQRDRFGLGGDATNVDKPLCWTYSQLKAASKTLAASLSAQGVAHGSQIIAIVYNEAEWALLFWATARLSCQFVPLDPRLFNQHADAVYLLRKINAAAIFVSDNIISQQVDEALKSVPTLHPSKCIINCTDSAPPNGWTTLSRQMLEGCLALPISDPNPRPDCTVLILFTSGTESLPKACPHTTISIGTPSLMLVDEWGLGPRDSLCQHLPCFHIFNIVVSLAFWLAGGTVVFPSASFNPAASLDTFRIRSRVHVACVATMVQALIAHIRSSGSYFCSPFAVILGGAPITPDILDLSKLLGAKRIVAGYGTTEAVATLMRLINAETMASTEGDVCLGKPQAGAWMRICQPGSRIPIRCGQLGELHQGGLPLIKGYLGSTAEQSSNFYEEDGINWMATGDQGYMDDEGQVYLLGRYKDLIIRGGENISPVKIEQCIGKLPGIKAVYVVGIPDPIAGEVPIAVIKQDEDKNRASALALQSSVASLLGQSFSPTLILDLQRDLGMDSYPTTTSGKVRKTTLRQWVVDYVGKLDAPRPSSSDLPTELTALWLAVSGLGPQEVDMDTPVLAFADSIMIIQFLYLVNKRKLGRLTQQDIMGANTIRKQAKLLSIRKEHSGEISGMKSPQNGAQGNLKNVLEHHRAKEVASSILTPLGFDWDDVEEVIPMTDYVKHFSSDRCRPSSWNLRAAFVTNISIDVAGMEAVLRLWLQRHPLLRATTAKFNEELELYLVMRLSQPWLRLQIIHGGEVEDANGVEMYGLNDPAFDWVNQSVGPLFKATILHIRDSSKVGLVLHFHHAIFDGLTLFSWARDLKELLRSQDQCPVYYLPYRDFAEHYQHYRTSVAAEKAVDFHVQRLRGLSLSSDSLWPPQKVPGWMKGDAQGWTPPDHWAGDRVLLDGEQSRGAQGINRSIHLSQLSEMRKAYEVTPPTIAKSACALVNLHLTGQEEALFTGVDSGRFWPIPNADVNASPFEIDGPTMTFYANRIRLLPGETAHDFLKRMQRDQGEISVHAHAPLDTIKGKLEEIDSSTGPADVAMLNDLFHRQTFNWLMQHYTESDSDPIRLVQSIGRTDLGFMWFPSLLPNDVLELNVTWDDSQLRSKEVYDVTTKYMCAVAWLSDPDNMNKPVTECQFEGCDGISYWVSDKFHR
ncbi:AMP-binding enzyme family protein [Aspergillus alliaceus]|uniref:AMP-binding enzyme family protein n=1 Tax=Petromyces alliaceus TaxID=209559 RepID=A0A5N7C9R8_PETAA|nr:AMP-binding enzyme family protein [Aspergillus alliaceus]